MHHQRQDATQWVTTGRAGNRWLLAEPDILSEDRLFTVEQRFVDVEDAEQLERDPPETCGSQVFGTPASMTKSLVLFKAAAEAAFRGEKWANKRLTYIRLRILDEP